MPDTTRTDAMMEAMGEVALLRDPAGLVVWVNDAFCRLFGGSQDEWRGADFGAPRVSSPGERRRYEGETATRGGRRWIEWEETALKGGGVLAIGRDITERRQAAPVDDEAASARRVGKAFFAAVTHELRTPLNGVLGMTGLLEQSGLKPDQAEYVAAIRESGDHLLAMINDVLDAARLEGGAMELDDGDVDCARLARSVVELLSPKAAEKGLEIAAVLDPALPVLTRGDEGRIRQILFNLAGAAVRRTQKGGVLVEARLDRGAAPDGKAAAIAFSVTDDGPEFSEQARVSMIDPALMEEGEEASCENAGLGLTVARRLVEAMGGDLEVESPPGRGARMTVRLTMEILEQGEEPMRISGARVIVASGSSALRAALCAQARLLGAEAFEAATPGAAEREAEMRKGCVLLAEAAWRDRLGDAVAAASASGLLLRPDQRNLIPDVGELGFDFYLMKPVRAESLAARLQGVQPKDEPEKKRAPARAPAPVQSKNPASIVNGARILLAEDNRVNALLASTMLRGEGCLVDIVGDGAEAVEAVKRADYDLVLMDVRMPVMNGLQATRAIRALRGQVSQTPIVALTANAFDEDRKRCLEAGMNDFAAKPIDMDGVAELLRKWTHCENQAKLA